MSNWSLDVPDDDAVRRLAEALVLSPLEAAVLVTRGISDADEAARFLSPAMDMLHDPFRFAEMERATDRLRAAIANRERILVHGDYDADGVCGAALIYDCLGKLGADVHFFVPDRAKDGYGLAERVMKRGVEVGLDLVVSVDCGSSDGKLIGWLAERGVDTIVTDHHETSERVPEACAFLNPKLPGESYPFAELAGTGVAFKLLQGLEKSMKVRLSLERLLDLVAIGTLGDYVPLRDENRILVSLGLERLRRWDRPGLAALRSESGLPRDRFSARRICFTLVPRLNSPGRMGTAGDVVRLLVTGEKEEAVAIAREMEAKNTQRRVHDSRVTEEASYLADVVLKRDEPAALVFSSASWHEGVVGIGAARIAERYNLPAALIAVRDGLGKGSVRSAGMVNVKDALERCAHKLVAYGGHREAGGFTIVEEDIPDFQRLFEEAVGELFERKAGSGDMHVDLELDLEDCTLPFVSFVERLAPFGPANHEPVFLVSGLDVMPATRIVGDGHLKLVARDASGAAGEFIGFSMGREWRPPVIIGNRFDVLAHLRRNVYNGREEPQLQIVEMRPAVDTVRV